MVLGGGRGGEIGGIEKLGRFECCLKVCLGGGCFGGLGGGGILVREGAFFFESVVVVRAEDFY